MKSRTNRKIQIDFDSLVGQIVEGRKTASVVRLGEVDIAEGAHDDPLVVGEYYDVYNSHLERRATIRITAMELCRWDNIPERLWRGETNNNAEEFRQDHLYFFDTVTPDLEFVAFYFELVKDDFKVD